MAIAPNDVVIPRWQRWSPADERRPRGAVTRWSLRLLLALPFAALALYSTGRGFTPPAVPPVVALVPGGPMIAGLATALLTGVALAALGERLVRWEVPLRVTVPLALVPALAYAGSQDLAAVLTLVLLALAVEGFVHFAVAGRPDGAVRAGLALAGAALCDPVAILYAAAFAGAAPFVAAARRRAEPTPPATWAVLLCPALTAFTIALLLDWRLTGQVWVGLDPAGPVRAAGEALLAVVHTPLYAAVAVVYAVRRPRALIGYLTPVAAVFVALLAGLAYSPVTGYLLLTAVALIAVPRAPSRRLSTFLATVALIQWAQVVTWPPTSPAFQEWLRVVWGF
ncbi:hypothetical protein O7635_32470 [Asanoa sp. WMMD1127]|uniref:hypothetical protein n=1 Tax=Asanoa sp. WMMD1127 TaxID=3016107 RepID=UPI0024162A00|nr:hypothetical protein [Asanoa sp. WMMD1127]MDG4826590.1 hypothetical protein [Asanoa sp. WMMD1127]